MQGMKLGAFLCLVFIVGFLLTWIAFFIVVMVNPVRVYTYLFCAYSVPLMAFAIFAIADKQLLEKEIFTWRNKKK